jgi:hypothetical protein
VLVLRSASACKKPSRNKTSIRQREPESKREGGVPGACLCCCVVLQERPSAAHAGKGCVSVSAFAVEYGRRRRAEPPPSCFELLPCKTSHAFRCSDRSDQVPSIRRVKRPNPCCVPQA